MTDVPPGSPEWRQQILSSGLIVATSPAPRPTERIELPPDLRPPRPVLLLPASAAPQPSDMLLVAPGTSDLGYPAATLSEVVDLLQEVPFEPAMRLVSMLAAEIYHHGRDARRHLRYAADMFWPVALARIQRFVAEEASHLVFDPRLILALQRLLIMHGAPDPQPARELTRQEIYHVAAALLALGDALPRAEPPAPREGEEPDWYAWTSFFAQSGAWYDDPYWVPPSSARFPTFNVCRHGAEGRMSNRMPPPRRASPCLSSRWKPDRDPPATRFVATIAALVATK